MKLGIPNHSFQQISLCSRSLMIHSLKAMLTTIMVHKNLLLWELDMRKNRKLGEMHKLMGSVTLQEITHPQVVIFQWLTSI